MKELGRSFHLFWTSMSVSVLGSELTTFAIPVIAAVTLGASPFQMGLLVACSQAPNIFVSILVGPAIDRSSMRNVLCLLDLGRGVILALVAVLAITGNLTVVLLAVVAFLLGCANSAFDTTYVAFTPHLVTEAELFRANSRVEASSSTAQVVGPSLGGVLVGVAGPALSAVSAAVAFIGAAGLILRVKDGGRVAGVGNGSSERQTLSAYGGLVTHGLRFVWTILPLRVIAISSGTFNFFSGASASVLTLFVLRELGLSPELYGLAVGVGSLGGLLGAALTPALVSRFGAPQTIGLSLLVAALGELIVVWSPQATLSAFIFVAVSTFIAVAGVTVFIVANISVRQQVTPWDRLASVYGSMRFISRGLLPLGALCSALLVARWGLAGSLVAVGLGQVTVAIGCLTVRKWLAVAPDKKVERI